MQTSAASTNWNTYILRESVSQWPNICSNFRRFGGCWRKSRRGLSPLHFPQSGCSETFWTLLCLLLVSQVFLNHGENWWPLIVKFWRIFGVSQCFSVDFRMPGSLVCFRSRVKNLMTPRDRARQKVLHSDVRFCQVCYVVTLNMTLSDPKSRFRTVSGPLCDVWWHDHTPCYTTSFSRRMKNLISSGGRRHWSGSRQQSSNP